MSLFAQGQLLDRVLARIGTEAITQTDVQSLVEFGLVDAKSASDPAAVRQAIERQLALKEVSRFPPAEPPDAAIEQQLAAMTSRVGARLDEVMRVNGLDEARVRGLARDTLRIRTYLDQRFGLAVPVGEDEARKYFDEHRDQFTRNGSSLTFEEAAADARQRVSAERLAKSVTQWLSDLRARSDVVLVTP
jgi:hypothetical protein